MTAAKPVVLLFSIAALGEIAVGAIALAFPQLIASLMDAPLDGSGLLVARMLGVAVLALGITWWRARRDGGQLSRHCAGFVVYNIGIGALFGWAAFAASHAAIPWVVCVAHLSAGTACIALAGAFSS